ncbi:hypothetical protein TNCV_822131 [Trichonephila clavipes]|nr:hypothetical protein TNCV_822131 [Trichonephila clavipes]
MASSLETIISGLEKKLSQVCYKKMLTTVALSTLSGYCEISRTLGKQYPSPLLYTPEASPSHEPSQDGISPMEQSMVSLEPLRDPPKIPVKKVASIIQRRPRSKERRTRDQRRSYTRMIL